MTIGSETLQIGILGETAAVTSTFEYRGRIAKIRRCPPQSAFNLPLTADSYRRPRDGGVFQGVAPTQCPGAPVVAFSPMRRAGASSCLDVKPFEQRR
jgi:hypothetical protein